MPPSHSQAPVIITAGRPIVILPNDYIHSCCDFTPGASLSAAFNLQPPIQSLGYLHDHIPAPIITPIDDDDYSTSAPAITHVNDNSPSVECMVPPKHISGVKAIDFTDNKHCIVPGQSEVTIDPCNKEEPSKQASLDVSCVDASKSEAKLNVVPKSPLITDFGVTSLPKLDPMPDDESANTEMPSQNLNPPLPEMESGSKAGSPLNLDKLQLPAQKSSSMRVSPLIMTCYEESKEQLVLDDSDSELEMPECSKSASCTPQESIELDTSESRTGTKVQAHNLSTNFPPTKDSVDGESDSYEPPPKRAKMVESSTMDSKYSPTADEYNHTPAGSGASQNSDTHNAIASSTAIAESSESFGQTVPSESLLFADRGPLEAAGFTNTSSTLATTVPDHSLKLECPHEPVDLANDGKDTINQMLPMESAREHAMVPNLVRCADGNLLNDDKDDPSDGRTHFKAYVPAVDLHCSCLESLEDVQVRVGDSMVPGQTVVEEKMETDIQVPELHGSKPYQHEPPNSDISATPQTDVCSPSMVVPSTIEPAQLPIEHQIVPDEFGNNTTPSSSQSLYTDHDFLEKFKPCLQVQDENSVDDGLDSSQVLTVSLNSIEKRWSVTATLPHSGDQALPDLGSPSKLPTQHYIDGGGPAGVSGSYGLDSDEQRGSSAQNFAPFGFQVGKHTSYSQSMLLIFFMQECIIDI